MCAQTCHCYFAGYIDENAVHEKFQGVPPLPAGSVCRFAAIVDELCPSGLAALFMYQHPAVQEYRKVGKACVSHAVASGKPLANTHTDRTQSLDGTNKLMKRVSLIAVIVEKART